MATTTHRASARSHGNRPLGVLVVDDHPLFRKGLIDLIAGQPGIAVCGEAGTVEAALGSIAAHQPDVAIIDLTLGEQSGLDLVSTLAASHPAVRVLVLSGHDERVHADRALKAGALGYIMKDKAASELLTAVRRVAAGKPYVSPETADTILSTLGPSSRKATQSPSDRLTDRERHVLKLVGKGLATREIAAEL